MENLKNFKFDTLVIEFQNTGNSVGSCSIGKIDLISLLENHNMDLGQVLLDMSNTIIESKRNEK